MLFCIVNIIFLLIIGNTNDFLVKMSFYVLSSIGKIFLESLKEYHLYGIYRTKYSKTVLSTPGIDFTGFYGESASWYVCTWLLSLSENHANIVRFLPYKPSWENRTDVEVQHIHGFQWDKISFLL